MSEKVTPRTVPCQSESGGTARDDLIRLLLPRVRVIANWHIRRMSSRFAIADDIYSAGLEGLVRGVDRYDPQHGEPRPYVDRRIEGEIRDYLRSLDHLTRHYRGLAKASGVEPWSSPISLDAPIGSVAKSLADMLPDEYHESPEATAVRRGQVAALERAARALPPRTRDILRRFYTDESNMVEIAEAYAVTESRVCQLIHEAHARIREALGIAPAPCAPVKPRAPRRRASGISDETHEILRQSAEARAPRRGPRECTICGEPGHRRDNARHRRAGGAALVAPGSG